MDCEKFESAMMDELYGELDELTSAAVKRHITGCARCAAMLGGLKATRRLALLPLVEPPADLEDRVLRAAEQAQTIVPLARRAARAVSLAGNWAMRPQTAMAAVFLVMIGTSLMLLRGKSSRAPASASITVTEEGTPAPVASVAVPEVSLSRSGAAPTPTPALQRAAEAKSVGSAPAPTTATLAARRAPAAKAANALEDESAPGDAFGSGASAAFANGPSAQTPAPGAGGGAAAPALTYAPPPVQPAFAGAPAQPAVRCDRFDRMAQRSSGKTSWDALLEGARCYAAQGDTASARSRLNKLLSVDSYKDRARAELERIAAQRPVPAASPAASPATDPSN